MTDDILSLASGTSRSFRSSTTSTATVSQSEFTLSYTPSQSSSTLTTPFDPIFPTTSSPSGYFKPLSLLSPQFKELPSKPLPPPPPVTDSDLLDMVTLLQSVNRSMKTLNASISSLTEDMSSIETMLITRELLIQDLSGLPGGVDALEDNRFVESPKRYFRNLYQKIAQTSLSYTPT